MRATLPELLYEAERTQRAVGAFTCYDVATAAAVLDAAEAADVGVILLVSPSAMARAQGTALVRALVALARSAAAPACVQLDHATRREAIHAALDCGVDAVLADGSRLSFDENVAFARAVAERAASVGAAVEVELGHVAGDEDVARAAAAGALTDPDQAGEFMRRTGADCLAVSIGNVHGRYAAPPQLDWARLERVRATVPAPLALHGASGLPDGDLRRAIAGGVRKVNVNTEIRDAQISALGRDLPSLAPGSDVLGVTDVMYASARAVVAARLAILGLATAEDDR